MRETSLPDEEGSVLVCEACVLVCGAACPSARVWPGTIATAQSAVSRTRLARPICDRFGFILAYPANCAPLLTGGPTQRIRPRSVRRAVSDEMWWGAPGHPWARHGRRAALPVGGAPGLTWRTPIGRIAFARAIDVQLLGEVWK